jgi:hypothetical protein
MSGVGHLTLSHDAIDRGWGNSGCEPDDFEFRRGVDSGENRVDPEHGRVLHFRLTALAALEHGQSLQNDN